MARFNLNLREANAKSETLINLIVRWEGLTLTISTGEYANPSEWIKTKQRLDVSKSNPNRLLNPQINTRLSKFISDAEYCFSEYQTIHHTTPTKSELLKLLNAKFHNKVVRIEKKNLFEFMESMVEEMITGINPKNGKPYAKKTPSTYYQCLNQLREFSIYSKMKVDFDTINLDFHHSFYEFLATHKGYRLNYVGKIIRTLKTFLNEAIERQLTTNIAHKGRRFVSPKEKVSNISLNTQELISLFKLDLSKEPRLEKVRDMFLFGCYTGLRFSDFSKIKPQYINLENSIIHIPTQKTGEDVSLPILPIAKLIINKYKDKTPNSLPPSIANQTFNRYIKEVAIRIPELNEEISVDYHIMGNKVSRTFKKWEKVSSHTARRSFATNLTLMGFPTQLIMKITGHRTESAFYTYLKISPIENANIIMREWESRMQISRNS
jgi:integrase